MQYRDAMSLPKEGDVICCDPPYSYNPDLSLEDFLSVIAPVGRRACSWPSVGATHSQMALQEGSLRARRHRMLERFQMNGKNLRDEIVVDRLLLKK